MSTDFKTTNKGKAGRWLTVSARRGKPHSTTYETKGLVGRRVSTGEFDIKTSFDTHRKSGVSAAALQAARRVKERIERGEIAGISLGDRTKAGRNEVTEHSTDDSFKKAFRELRGSIDPDLNLEF